VPQQPQAPRNIHVIDAATSTQRLQGRDHTVIRGVLPSEFYRLIIVPAYQRAAMKHHKHDELMEVLDPKAGIGIPEDLLLCVRTDQYRTAGSGQIVIPATNELFVLDGRQRMEAAWARLANRQPVLPFGVKIILDTTEQEEIHLFYQLNRLQTKVSTHVLLRNSGTTPATEALVEMTKNHTDLITVQWDQMPQAGDDITAHMLYEVAVTLHGRGRPKKIEDILERLVEVSDDFGTEQMAENVKTFFETVIACFGKTNKQPYMFRVDMLRAMARLLWDHTDFWDSKNPSRLLVPKGYIDKLSKVRLDVVQSGLRQSDAARDLYLNLVRQLNSGRRTAMLKERP
jgi:hypothetical protein